MTPKLDRLNQLLAEIRAKKTATLQPQELTVSKDSLDEFRNIEAQQIYDRNGNLITLNSKQSEFVSLAALGKSCVLIGAAGTGKTTCQKAVTQALSDKGLAGTLDSGGHRHLKSGTAGIIICAYTRRAVSNIRRNVSADLQDNCITIHKLLEYQPVYYEVIDEVTGKERSTMRFEATRNALNPLPPSIRVLIFEESSMLGLDLYQEVINACPHNPQLIFLGDIQQLPPVFGPAILGFKLNELPTVELTEVYRQALDSPIISLAHRILSGVPIPPSEYSAWDIPNKVKLHPWKKRLDDISATIVLGKFFAAAYNSGSYTPETDMILCPFNKGCGTLELNKLIANHIAKSSKSLVYEVIAGFNKLYLQVGEKVLYEKEDAEILDISPNPTYYGTRPQEASVTLDYWGFNSSRPKAVDITDEDVDFVLAQVASMDKEDRVRAASHIITLKLQDSDREITVNAAGDLNSLLLGYVLTVHKAQGSEWDKVFLCLHQSHATMTQRELLYTAVTRAKSELYVICEHTTFTKGIISQKYPGDTLEEKAAYFKGKATDQYIP